MLWTFRKYLIKALLIVAALFIAISLYTNKGQSKEVEVIEHKSEISKAENIIDEDMILGKLKAKSQIVSLEQSFTKKSSSVDDAWYGDRHTEMKLKGEYKLGLNTKDIEVRHIDSANKIVYIMLPDPVLISLELPFDDIEFDKTQGFLRLALDEDEQKQFYKSVEKEILKEIKADEDIHMQADLNNQEVVRGLLESAGIENVIF